MSKIRTLLFTLTLLATSLPAISQNDHVTINGSVFGGGNLANVGGSCTVTINQDGAVIDSDVYGGGALAKVNTDHTNNPQTIVTLTNGTVSGSVYGGGLGDSSTEADVEGNVQVLIKGGQTTNVFGCNNVNGMPQQIVKVQVDKGTVTHNVFGGGNLASYKGTPEVRVRGGNIQGNVFGGGNGDDDPNHLVAADVRGGNVTIKGGTIGKGVYGGCNANGQVAGDITVEIVGGTIGTADNLLNEVVANVHGGGYGASTTTTGDVTVTFGALSDTYSDTPTLYGDIYGGSALGNVNAAGKRTIVNVYNGSIEMHEVVKPEGTEMVTYTYGGNVYGGGLGDATHEALVNGKVTVNIGIEPAGANTNRKGAKIGGSVYGCNNANGSPQDDVLVNVYRTHHTDANKYPQNVDDLDDLADLIAGYNTAAYADNFALKDVYGGGNKAAYTPSDHTTQVYVWGCSENTIQTVYGGGNAANSTHAKVIVDGGRFDRIFGGGNGYSQTGNHTDPGQPYYNPGANLTSATTEIKGGLYRQIFGGSNQKGDVSNASLTINQTQGCTLLINESFGGANEADIEGDVTTTLACSDLQIGSFYGGSNLANIINGNVTLNVYGGTYNYVFGGSKGRLDDPDTSANEEKEADIHGDVTLNLYGGTIQKAAFGGSDVLGNITGVITVNVLDLESTNCPLQVDTIYGGGRLTPYNPNDLASGGRPTSPVVNVVHIAQTDGVRGNVFGGAFGATATVKSNPQVNIGYDASMTLPSDFTTAIAEADRRAAVGTNVYGGGNLAPVEGNATVNIRKANTNVSGDVYGGGNLAPVEGNTEVNMVNGTVGHDVYGGGALADVGTDGNNTTTVNITGGTVTRDVYGGGLGGVLNQTTYEPKVNGAVQVNVNGGSVRHVFGCNNEKGAPQSTVQVYINNNVGGNVYGGGNLAAYAGTPDVNIQAGTVTGSVFGGGNEADVSGGDVTMTGGSVLTGVYGGCNTKGTVNGNIIVNVKDGTVGTSATNTANVHGGGYGNQTATTGNVEVYIAQSGASSGPTIHGDVYGGSADGQVNATTNHTWVTLNAGTVKGSLYGGGMGINNANCNVNGVVVVNVNGGSVNNVFGCNNVMGAPQKTVQVNIQNNANVENDVYGGGNMAYYTGTPDVNVIHGTVKGNVFGGGNNITANNQGVDASDVTMTGGTVKGSVYGGCNTKGTVLNNTSVLMEAGQVETSVFGGGLGANTTVNGTATVQVNGTPNIGHDVYGGGDQGTVNATLVTITAGTIEQSVFGGGNQAGVTTTATVNINGGTVGNKATDTYGIYGGCNTTGTVSGAVTVNIKADAGASDKRLKGIFGGGYGKETKTGNNVEVNIGPDNTNPEVYADVYGGSALGSVNSSTEAVNGNCHTYVTLTKGTVYGDVYGGGLGQIANSSANPQVAAVEAKVWSPVTVAVNGGTVDTYTTAKGTAGGNVYGCNNQNGAPQSTVLVNVKGGTVKTNVYGGGNLANATVNPNVQINSGTVNGNVYGGGAFANTGNTTVDILDGTIGTSGNTATGHVFGGGLGGSSNGQTYTPSVGTVTVNIGAGTPNSSATGGATVSGGNATILGSVYGCNDTKGSPTGNVTVNVYQTHRTTAQETTGTEYAIDQVFGGGRNADFSTTGKKAQVNIFTCSNTIRRVFGGGDAAAAPGVETNIYGGRFGYVFGGGNGEIGPADIGTGGISLNIHGGSIGQLFGGSNHSGAISGTTNVLVDNTGGCGEYIAEFFGGGNEVNITGDVNTTLGCGTVFGDVYGGSNQANITGNVTLNITGGTYKNIFGGSKGDLATLPGTGHTNKEANIDGNVTLNLLGGTVQKVNNEGGNVFGGSNYNGNITGKITVNVLDVSTCQSFTAVNLYGAGNLTAYTPSSSSLTSPEVNVMHIRKTNNISGNVYGGGYGASATVTANPKVTIGYDNSMTVPTGYTVPSITYATILNNVYGGGEKAPVVGYTTLKLQGANTTAKNMYGGGDLAPVSGNTSVTVAGGTLSEDVYGGGALANVGAASTTHTVTLSDGTVRNVFGGGMGNTGTEALVEGQTIVNINGGTATGVYGGCNANGIVKGAIQVNANSGQVASIYGGGYGNLTTTQNNVTVTVDGTTVSGDVYGGSALGQVNNAATQLTKVWLKSGSITGNIYGGGEGQDGSSYTSYGQVNGQVEVLVTGGSVKDVFGCNNKNGAPQSTVQVEVEKGSGSMTVANVYGGGNLAAYTAPSGNLNNPVVNIKNGTITNNVYGGGKGEAGQDKATVTGNPQVTIGDLTTGHDAYLAQVTGSVFGGGDAAKVAGTPVVLVQKCNTKAQYVYGGGNKAQVTNTNVTVSGGNTIGNVFGGGNGDGVAVDYKMVTEDAVTNIQGGTIGKVFGGNNACGTIEGTIKVIVEKATDACEMHVSELYGGGNLADSKTNTEQITIRCTGLASKNEGIDYVYGGANQAQVTGDITLDIKKGRINHVFGGNNISGQVSGQITVNIEKTGDDCDWYVGDVYGAGNLAPYGHGPKVNIKNGLVSGNVYGGGLGASAIVSGNPEVTVGDITAGHENYTASVAGNVYGGGNEAAVNGSTTVLVQQANSTVSKDVYGGGALANTGGSEVTLDGGTVRNLYGGGLGQATPTQIAAQVTGPVQVTVNGGTVNNVFGCNNYYGAPTNTVRVDVNSNVGGSVYGGGNLAPASVSPTVYINNGTVSGSVFAGGLGATAIVTGAPTVTVGTTNGSDGKQASVSTDVYGGGDAANVAGTTTVLVQKCNTVISGDVYGGGNAADIVKNGTTGGTTSVTVTGGTINSAVYGGGHGDKSANPVVSANVAVSTDVTINGGTINQVFGGSNSAGTINGGNTGGISVTVEKDDNACDLHITEVYGGGNFAASQAGNITIGCTGTVANANEGIQYVYGGANRADVTGNIELTIEEGRIANVFGGNNNSGAINGTITVNIDKKASPCVWDITNVFGGGNLAAYSGTPTVNVKNGAVTNVYGGGNEANVGGGNVLMSGGQVLTGLYGGCNTQGNVSGDITVTITGGEIGTQANLNTANMANVFGGGYGKNTTTSGNVTVNFGGTPDNFSTTHSATPTLYGDIYGGSAFGNVNNDASDRTTVNLLNGTLETITEQVPIYNSSNEITGYYTAYHGGNVYGGGLGRKDDPNTTVNEAIEALVKGKVTVNIGTGTIDNQTGYTTATSGEATIKGNVYGCNNTNGSPQENVTVNIFHTHLSATDSVEFVGTPPSTLTYALANVFGGGNEANFQVTGKTAKVNIYGCDNSIQRTFGGGNAAATNEVFTMIQGGRINEAYGGGNGEVSPANVQGDVHLAIHGGTVGQSFAGSNQQGTISGHSSVTVDSESGCGDAIIEEFFCGGNFADYHGNIDATIECAAGLHIKNLYGGCKQANVVANGTEIGDIHLVVKGGTYENIYGGSQGRLADPTATPPITEKSADINGSVHLEINGGTVTNAIYGGSHILGKINGTIVVDVENKNTGCELDLSAADVYGGGNQANYGDSEHNKGDYPQVNIKNATVKNVFGGGLQADIYGNPQIKLKYKAKVLGNVYGGGNMGIVNGNPRIIVNGKMQ